MKTRRKHRILSPTQDYRLERRARPQTMILAEAIGTGMSCLGAAHTCWMILGFSKPHNSSNKKLARLKHSLTVITLQTL